jgi:hypothetical protein
MLYAINHWDDETKTNGRMKMERDCHNCGRPYDGQVCPLPRWKKDYCLRNEERLLWVAMESPVEQPKHYQQYPLEVIEVIRLALGPEGFKSYCFGNELKYRLRAGFKGDATEDIAKAEQYRKFREG